VLAIAVLAVMMVSCYATIGCAVAAFLWHLTCRARDRADQRRTPRATRPGSAARQHPQRGTGGGQHRHTARRPKGPVPAGRATQAAAPGRTR